MRSLFQTTALCLAMATPACADIVFQGRDAQGLHCASMLLVVGATLEGLGAISPSEARKSTQAAAIIMQQLPGTDAEKLQAIYQRSDKIMATRTTLQLFDEFSSISRWCIREFSG